MPNFNSANKGIWFYFDPTNEKLGGVCLRELSTDENNRIEQMTVRHRKKVMRGVLIDDSVTDEKLASKLRWDFCITDWREIILDGQTLDCTADNKVKIMNVTDFVKHVVDSLERLVQTNRTLDEARAKNLKSSSSGKLKSRSVKTA